MFSPAINKLEAVNRISELTYSGPQNLGPGSKERKSVLLNLAHGVGLLVDAQTSKQQLARLLATKLNFEWNSDCESVGQTITLKGLNLLLENASLFLEQKRNQQIHEYGNPTLEARQICETLKSLNFETWDGRKAVSDMKEADYVNWKQTEWQGWYFEYLALPLLVNKLGGGRRNFANTNFDYCLQRTWDLKTHSLQSKKNDVIPLNDKISMDQLITEEGMGLILLNGTITNSITFDAWHKNLRGQTGLPRRKLKASFSPINLEIYWFDNNSVFEKAISDGIVQEFKQGKQSSGHARKVKYKLNATKASSSEYKIIEVQLN